MLVPSKSVKYIKWPRYILKIHYISKTASYEIMKFAVNDK